MNYDWIGKTIKKKFRSKKSKKRKNQSEIATSEQKTVKEFLLTEQKTTPKTEFERIGKTISEKPDHKN